MAEIPRSEKDPEYMKIAPQSLRELRGDVPVEQINIPEVPQNRKCTNKFYLITVLLIILFWMIFVTIAMSNVDFRKVLHGVDRCGNICGINNVEISAEVENIYCEAKDYTNYPLVEFYEPHSKCVEKCGIGHEAVLNRCIDEEREYDLIFIPLRIMDSLYYSGPLYPVLITIAIVISLLVFIIYRFRARLAFWGTLVSIIILLILWASLTWLWFRPKHLDLNIGIGAYACLFLILLLAYIGRTIYVAVIGRYKMIIPTIAEASNALFKMPVLLVFPLMPLLVVFAVHGFCFYMNLVHLNNLLNYGVKFRHDDSLNVESPYSLLHIFISIISIIIFFIVAAFMNGFQYMVVAGSVASYYFTKDKTSMQNMVFVTSLYVTIRYHLGTAAAGSLVVTILSITRAITEMVRRKLEDRSVCLCCCYYSLMCCICVLEEVAEYLAKRAYIMTALHGKGILESGKRAARLMWHFHLDTLPVHSMACNAMNDAGVAIFLFTMQFCLVMTTGPIWHHLIDTFVAGMYVGTVIFFYISLMNATIVTIFLCFCEDKIMNDGSASRPYFMSGRLLALTMTIGEKIKEKNQKKS